MMENHLNMGSINKVIPIRMSPHEELLGADIAEHMIKHHGVGVTRALSTLMQFHEDNFNIKLKTIKDIGSNPGHEAYLHVYVANKLNRMMKEMNDSYFRPSPSKADITKTDEIHFNLDTAPKFAWLD